MRIERVGVDGYELCQARNRIATDLGGWVLAEFDPLGYEKVEWPASLNFDVEFAWIVFAGTGQDDKGALVGEDVRIATCPFA